VVNPPVTKILI